MATLKSLRHQQAFIERLHDFIEVSQEIAVMRMQKVRTSVLETRAYMEGIISIFTDVRASREGEVQKLIDIGKTAPSSEYDERLTILLSPSGKFAGPLIQKVSLECIAYIKKNPSALLIVGETGKELTSSLLKTIRNVSYVSLNLDVFQEQDLSALLKKISMYKNITVFTGKFNTLINQTPQEYNISGYQNLPDGVQKKDESRLFLFEPDLGDIISYFEKQISQGLFRRTVSESHLAHLGSRIETLEASLTNTAQSLKKAEKKVITSQRKVRNRQQFNRISGMRMWK